MITIEKCVLLGSKTEADISKQSSMNGGGFVGLGCLYSDQFSSVKGVRQKFVHFQCFELKIDYKILLMRSVHNTMKLVLLFCKFLLFFPMT